MYKVKEKNINIKSYIKVKSQELNPEGNQPGRFQEVSGGNSWLCSTTEVFETRMVLLLVMLPAVLVTSHRHT